MASNPEVPTIDTTRGRALVCITKQNGEEMVGMGVLLSYSHIITCAHVINDALGRPPRTPEKPTPDTSVSISFPFLTGAHKFAIGDCQALATAAARRTIYNS